jgi:hypothetical protein
MSQLECAVCGAPSEGGHWIGDSRVFMCPQCGGYRLSGTAIHEFEAGGRQKPNPAAFRDLVSRKRGNADDYPLITSGDLSTLA